MKDKITLLPVKTPFYLHAKSFSVYSTKLLALLDCFLKSFFWLLLQPESRSYKRTQKSHTEGEEKAETEEEEEEEEERWIQPQPKDH